LSGASLDGKDKVRPVQCDSWFNRGSILAERNAIMVLASSLPRPLNIMGVNVIPFESYSQVCEYVDNVIASRRKSFCVAVNPEKAYGISKNPDLLAVLRQADVTICDGIGIALAARLLHGQRIRRCTGCDLFLHLAAKASERGWKVFLLGASSDSNALACSRLTDMYPGLNIVGRQDGYFTDPMGVVNQINRSRADLLFVAMGSPKQELWIARHREAIHAPFCMGVGGSFDVVSGKAKRAPKLFRQTGTEFLYRLVINPRRWKRQVVLPLFMMKLLQSWILRTNGTKEPVDMLIP
jgi:N-acetylglucosaminyldiphosphoundecaprenol N-acetyl-beta-D-mannosaminyltransferase